jgi:peptidyl-prolyl cis-trans isomerase-like protein 2
MTKERLYVRAGEVAGRKRAREGGERERRALDCCALSLEPWTTPVLSPAGAVFELGAIALHVRRHGRDPFDAARALSAEDLVPLHFERNAAGELHCPVTFKELSKCRVGAIRSTGNVFSLEALQQLCIGPKSWLDPLSGVAFRGADDIVILVDPSEAPAARAQALPDMATSSNSSSSAASYGDTRSVAGSELDAGDGSGVRLSSMAQTIMAKAREAERKRGLVTGAGACASTGGPPPPAPPQVGAVGEKSRFSSGLAAASLTSTALAPALSTAPAEAGPEERELLRKQRLRAGKKKGYCQLQTSLGNLNLELHCDLRPTTCENFLLLCSRGYFDGTLFHRLIKGFMVQGGDPTGSGSGGESAWGGSFADEITPADAATSVLQHAKRGVLSMANSGPNTNASQFFITFAPCQHLDGKHAVFGRLVGGHDVLDAIEQLETDAKERPTRSVLIKYGVVLANPIQEERDEYMRKYGSAAAAAAPSPVTAAPAQDKAQSAARTVAAEPKKPKLQSSKPFSNFDDW